MKKFAILKDTIKLHSSDKRRVYHSVEGTYDGHYFSAKTDNSHKHGFVSYGIKKGAVYILDVWKGGHPVGRDSIQGKGIHVSHDLIAHYYNKWDLRPRTNVNKAVVNTIVSKLEIISNKKSKTTTRRIKNNPRNK